MAKKKDEQKQEFGDIIQNTELVKRTLMVAAFPGLVKETTKDGKKVFEGFLPGFEFAEVENIADENEIVETLQDMLDDEVEELVVFGKSLPYVDEDEVLMEKYPEHKIVYLDINVYATAEELEYYDSCTHDCANCSHSAECLSDEEYEDDCCCEDDECNCGHHHHYHEDHCACGCEDDEDECDCGCNEHECDCDENCDCGCQEGEECTCHEHEHHCSCGCHDNECDCDEDCDCGCHEGKECTCNEEGHKCSCGCHDKEKENKGKKNCKSKK